MAIDLRDKGFSKDITVLPSVFRLALFKNICEDVKINPAPRPEGQGFFQGNYCTFSSSPSMTRMRRCWIKLTKAFISL